MESHKVNNAILKFFEDILPPKEVAKIEPVRSLDEIKPESMLFLPRSEGKIPFDFQVVKIFDRRISGKGVEIAGVVNKGRCNPYRKYVYETPVWYTTSLSGEEQHGFEVTQSQVDKGQVYIINNSP